MRTVFTAALASAAFLGACIEINRDIEVTPGTVPPEIQGVRWSEIPVAYCIVNDQGPAFTDRSTFIDATQRAMTAWSVPTRYEGDCAGPVTPQNGINEIGWGSLGIRADDLTEAGNTTLRYRSRSGRPPEIIEADIVIERAPGDKATEACLYTTMLHETGHLFGVPHLDMSTVMAPVITDCLQELTEADQVFIDDLY